MPQSNSVFGLVEEDLNQRQYTSAMMKLIKLSNDFSKDLKFLTLLARTQTALKDFTSLVKTLTVKAQITEATGDYLDLLNLLYAEGRLNEALDVALLLQERNPAGIELRLLNRSLIKIYLEFSDYEGIQEVIDADKTSAQDDFMLWAMGLVHLSAQNKNEALEMFRKAVEINAMNDSAWVSLSMLHEEMGDRELALANLEKALDSNPQNSTALKLMTKWYRRDAEQTQKMFEKVRYYLSEHEFDEEISLCHMQMLTEERDLNSARFEVEKLVLNNPTNTQFARMKHDMKKNTEEGMKTT